jgi:hypothetical protein
MTEATMKGLRRGGIYTYNGLRRAEFLVISVDALNSNGTVIIVEVSDHAPDDVRGLLAVQLDENDPMSGRWVLCWRINYAGLERFDLAGGGHGTVTQATLAAVLNAVKSSIEPL